MELADTVTLITAARSIEEGIPMRTTRISALAAFMAAALALASPVSAQIISSGLAGDGDAANPRVLRPVARPFGQSYGEWSALWWQWIFSLPVDQHPLFDTADCGAGQSGQVWFLGGTFSVLPDPNNGSVVIGEAMRDCAVPAGKALFFPIVNVACTAIDAPAATEADLRACANSDGDHMGDLHVTVDGDELEHLDLYRTESPLFTVGPLPDNNVLEEAPGTTTTAVGDGIYIMLAPLPRGRHNIHFSGAIVFTIAEDGLDLTFRQDITYELLVGPSRAADSEGLIQR